MDDVTGQDFERLRAAVAAALEAQQTQQERILKEVRAQLGPIVELAAIQAAQRERLTATIH